MDKIIPQEKINEIHSTFKAKLIELCHEFNSAYLGYKSPYYPQAAYIQLAAVTELLEELKHQLKISYDQKWIIIYVHPDG